MIADLTTRDGKYVARKFTPIHATMEIRFTCDCATHHKLVVHVPGDPLMARNHGGMELFDGVIWVKRKRCPDCQKEWIVSPTVFGGSAYEMFVYEPTPSAQDK